MRGVVYVSGGSSDDACLAIPHLQVIINLVEKQAGEPAFNPRAAVRNSILPNYGLRKVHGDKFGGETFIQDFRAEGISVPALRAVQK